MIVTSTVPKVIIFNEYFVEINAPNLRAADFRLQLPSQSSVCCILALTEKGQRRSIGQSTWTSKGLQIVAYSTCHYTEFSEWILDWPLTLRACQFHQLVMSSNTTHPPDGRRVHQNPCSQSYGPSLCPTSNHHLPLPPSIYNSLPKVHKERLGLPNRQQRTDRQRAKHPDEAEHIPTH